VTRNIRYNNKQEPEYFRLLPILLKKGWRLGGQEIVLPMSKDGSLYAAKTAKLQVGQHKGKAILLQALTGP
jgi:hypothetical protein